MLHIFNTIIDETTVARSRWQGNSERRARAFYRGATIRTRNDAINCRANAREYLFCQVIGNFGSGLVSKKTRAS
jgi:hypothetical protein